MGKIEKIMCTACNGTGKREGRTCSRCQGRGQHVYEEVRRRHSYRQLCATMVAMLALVVIGFDQISPAALLQTCVAGVSAAAFAVFN